MSFDVLEAALSRCRLSTGAAECHGTVCGAVCAGAEHGAWLEELASGELAADCRDLLMEMEQDTRRQLGAFDMEFVPCVPEDAAPLAQRVQALGEWCQGFLYGLSLGRTTAALKGLPGEAGEVLRDVGEIARAGSASVEGEGDETDENAYAELVEYLRVGVQVVYEELQRLPPDSVTRH